MAEIKIQIKIFLETANVSCYSLTTGAILWFSFIRTNRTYFPNGYLPDMNIKENYELSGVFTEH